MTLNFDTSKTVSEKWAELVRTAVPRCKNCRFWQKWDRDADCTKFYPRTEDGDWEAADYETGDMARASYSDSGCIHFEVKDDIL